MSTLSESAVKATVCQKVVTPALLARITVKPPEITAIKAKVRGFNA
jgi:hypothetical protein